MEGMTGGIAGATCHRRAREEAGTGCFLPRLAYLRVGVFTGAWERGGVGWPELGLTRVLA